MYIMDHICIRLSTPSLVVINLNFFFRALHLPEVSTAICAPKQKKFFDIYQGGGGRVGFKAIRICLTNKWPINQFYMCITYTINIISQHFRWLSTSIFFYQLDISCFACAPFKIVVSI